MTAFQKKITVAAALLFAAIAATAGTAATGLAAIMARAFDFLKLNKKQRESVAAITAAFQQYGDGDTRKLAYLIATAFHESNLRPIREFKAQPGTVVWEQYQKNYWDTGYYGRGFVQITWRDNYKRMGDIIGVDLVATPDLALQPDIAAQILVRGLMRGVFTGKNLGDYITPARADFYNARRTVGAFMVAGKDTGAIIQGYAETALKALNQQLIK